MNNFYVYIHRKKSNNEIFYVGKGKGKRAYSIHNRNNYWNKIINKHGFIVEILKDNLTEDEAFKIEIETIEQYKKQNITLCNMTSGGEGTSGYIFTDEDRRKIGIHFQGIKHHNYDHKIYNFINENGIIEKCTRYELINKYNLDRMGIGFICNKKYTISQGWRLLETERYGLRFGKDNPSYNPTIYTFYNEELQIKEITTQNIFRKKYDFNHSAISAICRGKRKIYKGWIVLESK